MRFDEPHTDKTVRLEEPQGDVLDRVGWCRRKSMQESNSYKDVQGRRWRMQESDCLQTMGAMGAMGAKWSGGTGGLGLFTSKDFVMVTCLVHIDLFLPSSPFVRPHHPFALSVNWASVALRV